MRVLRTVRLLVEINEYPSEEQDCSWGTRMAADGTMELRLNLPGTFAIQTPSSTPEVHLTYKSYLYLVLNNSHGKPTYHGNT
jgi:hypothetical protein